MKQKKSHQTLPNPSKPPQDAIAFVCQSGFWYWQLASGGFRSVTNSRYWLGVLGGECELIRSFGQEPNDAEFAAMMGWLGNNET